MRVGELTSNYSNKSVMKKNVSFGDDCGPILYGYDDAMKKLRKSNYIVNGYNNTNAFNKLYEDVDKVLQNKKLTTDAMDVRVIDMEISKEQFSGLMSRFWENSKKQLASVWDSFKQRDALIQNFLIKNEGIKKPGFWAGLFGGSEFYMKNRIIDTVIEHFIKTGQHRLK